MHGDEANVALLLDERLRPVAVVNVPVDDQHSLGAVPLTRVVCADGHVPEEAETHRASADRVVTWRANRAEASPGPTPVAEREVDAVEHRTGGRGRRIPGSFAHDGVRIEPAAAGFGQRAHRLHVRAIVRDRQLVDRRVARVDVRDASEELGIVA